MPAFSFRLQAVLEHRRTIERARQREVAELDAARRDAEARLDALRAALDDERSQLRALVAGGSIDLAGARRQAHASMGLMARARKLAVDAAGAAARLERARLALIRATVDRKAVETLRRRRFEAWQAEETRRETAAADELAMAAAARATTGAIP